MIQQTTALSERDWSVCAQDTARHLQHHLLKKNTEWNLYLDTTDKSYQSANLTLHKMFLNCIMKVQYTLSVIQVF